MTDWGREIIVDGARPAWLTGGQTCDLRTSIGWVASDTASQSKIPAEGWKWQHDTGETCIIAIRLPADSYVYRALDAGFEPWPGGDNAPDDWDGGDVLWNDGFVSAVPAINRWERPVPDNNFCYVVGYRRKSEPTLRTSDEALRRMEALVRRMAARSRAIPGGPIESDHADAREIVKLLPEPPVDPDLLEARKIMAVIAGPLTGNPSATKEYLSGEKDNAPAMRAVVAGIRRGRELAAER